MVSWGHQNVVVKMILPVIFIIKSITLSCLIRIVIIIFYFTYSFIQKKCPFGNEYELQGIMFKDNLIQILQKHRHS